MMPYFHSITNGNFGSFRSVTESWLTTLHRDLRQSQRAAFARGSVRNLKSQWNKFREFCRLATGCTLPISTHYLCLYIQFLSRSLKAPQSIRNYISGLHTFHSMLELEFPSLTDVQVRLTLKGLSKLLQHVPRQALPVTPSLLRQLHQVMDLQDPVFVVFHCLFLFLFFLFSRASQFIPRTFKVEDTQHLVRREHVSLVGSMLLVTFRWTKTLQAGGRVLVIPLVPMPGSPLCPVAAYCKMLQLVPAPPSSPAFVMPKSLSPVSYPTFQTVFRRLVAATGTPNIGFSTHSFRRGGATFAFQSGVPGELIQAQGDWASDCYKLYIRLDFGQRLRVVRSMSLAIC